MNVRLKRYWFFLCSTLLFLLGMESVSAQHYIGVMGGWGGGMARFKPTRETGFEWGLYAGGLSYKFYSETKYVGGIEIDLLFMQKGFNYDLSFESDESYHRQINAIELPFIWQPHVYLFQRHARFFINLGVQVSYNISSTYSLESRTLGRLEGGKYTMQLNRDNRFGYGLCGGAGLAFLFGQQRRYEFSIEARYGYGYGDILRNGTKYKDNPDRSPLDNINAFAAFYYRLGKEGIRSTPSVATQRRMEQEAARHTLRRMNKQLTKGETPADTLLLMTLPRDSTGKIPIDSTTIEEVRLYLTAPPILDTLQDEQESDTLTLQPIDSTRSELGQDHTELQISEEETTDTNTTTPIIEEEEPDQQSGEEAQIETSVELAPPTTETDSAERQRLSSSLQKSPQKYLSPHPKWMPTVTRTPPFYRHSKTAVHEQRT